jgi:hypothetical protein
MTDEKQNAASGSADKVRLDQIRERAKKATWFNSKGLTGNGLLQIVLFENVGAGESARMEFNGKDARNDGWFYFNAREDIPWLLEQLAAVEAELRQERKLVGAEHANYQNALADKGDLERKIQALETDKEDFRGLLEDAVNRSKALEAEVQKLREGYNLIDTLLNSPIISGEKEDK